MSFFLQVRDEVIFFSNSFFSYYHYRKIIIKTIEKNNCSFYLKTSKFISNWLMNYLRDIYRKCHNYTYDTFRVDRRTSVTLISVIIWKMNFWRDYVPSLAGERWGNIFLIQLLISSSYYYRKLINKNMEKIIIPLTIIINEIKN